MAYYLDLIYSLPIGVFLLYYGYNLLFYTEGFLNKRMKFFRKNEYDLQYTFLSKKLNSFIDKIAGIVCLIMGTVIIVLPVLRHLRLIK